MPAIITHDQFGREALARGAAPFVATERERQAFLLGNQGPDPLFYCVANPTLLRYGRLGNLMHSEKPTALLAAVAASVAAAPASAQAAVRAWATGFLCHYLLDRTAHPLIYAQEYALCRAGIPGLGERDNAEVHAVIESELDEMVLFRHTGKTVASFAPQRAILQADEQELSAISYALYRAVAQTWPEYANARTDLFRASVHCFRRVQGLFHSPTGTKRKVLGRMERLVRPHSFAQAMMHRPLPLSECRFDNHEGDVWENPFTGETSTVTFDDLFEKALSLAAEWVPRFATGTADMRALTSGLNFSGESVE